MISRLLYIGQEATASALFVDSNGNPLTPSNPTLHPWFRVVDPEQELVTAGVGTLNQNTLMYEANFVIPNMAMISTDDTPYHIEWEMKDITGAIYNYKEAFEVAYPDYDITAAKEQQKLTLPFTSLPLSLPLPNRVSDVRVDIYSESNSTSPMLSIKPKQVGIYTDYYVYSATVAPNIFTANNRYMAVWIITDGGMTYSFAQTIYCASLWEMSRISDLRMYLDKVQKNVDIYQGYRDSDLYFYLLRGNELINGIGIPTNWTMTQWSTYYRLKDSYYWLLIAARHEALRSQYLAEGDSTFNFSGQPVSLDADRTGFIESELSRLKDDLDNGAKAWKNQTVKNIKAVGHLNLTSPSTSTRFTFLDLRAQGINMPLYPTFRA